MKHTRRGVGLTLLGLCAAVALASCGEDRITFVREVLVNRPDAAALGFVGYNEPVEDGVTVCGSCHIGKQIEWSGTAHARAWADLEASPLQEPDCAGCHTVSELGNPVVSPAGYSAVAHPRYEDVQCESCHGPGLDHVDLPDDEQPLASLSVGVDLTAGCGECHSAANGGHHPFVDEWAESDHANLSQSRAGNESCTSCHSGDGALKAWGIDTRYVEGEAGEHIAITCGVCHDPHGSPNSAQLRFPIESRNIDTNLCTKCHQRNPEPDPARASRGPHSPQGPLVFGDAGWWPPNVEIPPLLISSHGSSANPRMCATCHLTTVETVDQAGVPFESSGHLFLAIPCLDGSGIPTSDRDCPDAERSFAACTQCHGEGVAQGLKFNAEGRVADLVDELLDLLDQVPATEFDDDDDRLSVAEGAGFNRKLAEDVGSVVHNPFLIESLLRASIRAVEDEYGLAASPGLDLSPQLTPPPGGH